MAITLQVIALCFCMVIGTLSLFVRSRERLSFGVVDTEVSLSTSIALPEAPEDRVFGTEARASGLEVLSILTPCETVVC